MARRDPNKTARNKIIAGLKENLRTLLPVVLSETGFDRESSLNATIGSKTDLFFDLKNDVIASQDQFVNKWIYKLTTTPQFSGIVALLKESNAFKQYLLLFLKRSYLNHYDELSRTRPNVGESEIWIGQNNANYGLLVTP